MTDNDTYFEGFGVRLTGWRATFAAIGTLYAIGAAAALFVWIVG